MNPTPPVERYEDLNIYTYDLKMKPAFWAMISDNNLTGTPLSYVWVIGAAFTDIPINKNLTTDILIVFRNQSDYSNVIVLTGTFAIECLFEKIGSKKMLFKLTDFLFQKAKEFIVETKLIGEDGNPFIMPAFHYTPDWFDKMGVD